jgi:histidinol dehydrogenase
MTAPMTIIDLRNDDLARWKDLLSRRYQPSTDLVERVAAILAAVRDRGDEALIELTKRFDNVDLLPGQLQVSAPEIVQAQEQVEPDLLNALRRSRENVTVFAKRTLRTGWLGQNSEGAAVGERFDPLQRVGIYVPAGTAPLVSTAIMTVSLASAAGVPEIAVTSPVGPNKTMDPGLLAALQLAGATVVYKVGGAQAIAALAFGTRTIRPVLKVFGPGNAYVTEAKRQVFGFVGVDLLPGPSEIVVVADHTANPAWVAADLLAQAEHGSGSVICLVGLDEKVASNVRNEINLQVHTLGRQSFLWETIEKQALTVIAKDRPQAAEIVNEFAPEHVSIAVENPDEFATAIKTAGAIFIGHFSPVAAGDFLAGPSHELPTGGAAKFLSGLTADQFQRRTSLVRYDKEALEKSVAALNAFSRAERLDAHGRSVTIRLESGPAAAAGSTPP